MIRIVGSRNCELSGVKPVKVNGQMSFIVLFQIMIESPCGENKKTKSDLILVESGSEKKQLSLKSLNNALLQGILIFIKEETSSLKFI